MPPARRSTHSIRVIQKLAFVALQRMFDGNTQVQDYFSRQSTAPKEHPVWPLEVWSDIARQTKSMIDHENMPLKDRSAAETLPNDKEIHDAFSQNDVVVVSKEELTDGVLVKSSVFGESAKVQDPNWNGLVKVEILTGAHKGETKSYLPKYLVPEGQENGSETLSSLSRVKIGEADAEPSAISRMASAPTLSSSPVQMKEINPLGSMKNFGSHMHTNALEPHMHGSFRGNARVCRGLRHSTPPHHTPYHITSHTPPHHRLFGLDFSARFHSPEHYLENSYRRQFG